MEASSSIEVSLNEEDIPGACLHPPFEKHTKSALRWWLLCRGVTVPISMSKAKMIESVHETLKAKLPLIDVDGVYVFKKLQKSGLDISSIPLPCQPLNGWEDVSLDNVETMALKIPRVTSGVLYNYLASGCGKKETAEHGAFRALKRGYIHWASGRLNSIEVHYVHPHFCHIRCKMTPSMRAGIYRVYMLLARVEGDLATIEKATCECAAGESASCTHISALLHALVAMRPNHQALSTHPESDNSDTESDLPVTSFACQWKQPRTRKASNLKFTDVNFEKHVYGRQRKHQWRPINDFDPRPVEHRGSAPRLMDNFLRAVKGKGLGVSVLLDKELRFIPDSSEASSNCSTPEYSTVETSEEIAKKVEEFKQSLKLTPDKIREIESNTREQALSPLWFSARRFRLTASVFGRIFHMRPSTAPDSLIKSLLDSKSISSPALEWGKRNESIALQEYIKHNEALGNKNMVVCKAGFVVCEEHSFLGASPDAYVFDPQAENQYGLVEIKCPYKYRGYSPIEAARQPDFCCSVNNGQDSRPSVELKRSHVYYIQVQGQMAITERKWCDFTVYTSKGMSIERIAFDEEFWRNEVLPKLVTFYDKCMCPSIVSPVHILGMKVHDFR